MFVYALIVDGDDQVARTNAGLVGRRTAERRDYHCFDGARLRADLHADAVVSAVLLFPHAGKLFRIERIGVRIEGPQHARNCALINALIRRHLVGIVLFNQIVHLGERFEACIYVLVRSCRWSRVNRAAGAGTQKPAAQGAAYNKNAEQQKEHAAGTAIEPPRSSPV